jgi:thymidylate kinase
MIIELFGPPGVGKTTFAYALGESLRDRGHVVTLFLSYRPAERPPSVDVFAGDANAAGVARRLMRPAVEMLALALRPVASSVHIRNAVALIRILPPNTLLWTVRWGQYIVRLSHAWQQASQADHIALFDQAFVQVVCSLALCGRAVDETLVAQALDSVPKADLSIRLNAPYETLKARLYQRESRQSRIERLLEPDRDTSFRFKPIIDHVHEHLRKRGQPVIGAASLDQRSLRESVEWVGKQINAESGTRCGGAA